MKKCTVFTLCDCYCFIIIIIVVLFLLAPFFWCNSLWKTSDFVVVNVTFWQQVTVYLTESHSLVLPSTLKLPVYFTFLFSFFFPTCRIPYCAHTAAKAYNYNQLPWDRAWSQTKVKLSRDPYVPLGLWSNQTQRKWREREEKKNKAIKLPASKTQRKMKLRSVLQNSNPPKKKNEKKKKN